VFYLEGIDPDRPFILELTHPELGTMVSETLELAPGETLDGIVLQYED